MSDFVTRFGSLDNYEKGHIEIINDNPKNYAFSNVFEVASGAKPYEKIAVAKISNTSSRPFVQKESHHGWQQRMMSFVL